MITKRELPEFLWAEAVAHATYVRNQAPTRALDHATPEEVWSGKKPDMSYLQEFGVPVCMFSRRMPTNPRCSLGP
ncbi:hypothetical protein BDR04DRAFT_1039216 [Suillus decipiens]|nr:hypothetical protein BDR04DRAFT_1039216 [Suillus decipiens]